MPKPHSPDLRIRVIRRWEKGDLTWDELAELFQVGVASVNRWVALYRETSSVLPRPHGGGYPTKIPEKDLRVLQATVDARPDSTLAELRDAFERATRRTVSTSTISRALARLGYSRKKSLSSQSSASGRRWLRLAPGSSARSGGSRSTASSSSTSRGRTSR